MRIKRPLRILSLDPSVLAVQLFMMLNVMTLPGTVSAEELITIKYVGSSTIGRFIRDAEPVYGRARFAVDTEPESYGGGWACAQGQTDLGGIAGPAGPDILEKGGHLTLIGKDDIAVIVNPANPVSGLSSKDLAKIFTGVVKNWAELKGSRIKIQPFAPSTFSATRNIFRAAILGEADYEGVRTVAPDEEIIDQVARSPGGIGIISYAFLTQHPPVSALTVNGEAAGAENFAYPLSRPLYLCTKGKPRGEAKRFIDWVLGPSGQQILMKRFVGARVLMGVKPTPLPPKRPEGYLIVYTETTPFQESGGVFYYPHLPYDILDEEGRLVLRVPNHRSNYDESPTRVTLPAGRYLIRAESLRVERPEVVVTIEEGQTTTVNFEEMLRALPKKKETKEMGLGKIEFYGDARIRVENDFHRDAVSGTRTRPRFRFRLGGNIDVNGDLRFGFRLATGNLTDPNSPHETFTGVFDRKNFAIDRAFLQWNPKRARPVTLWAGKFAHPFSTPAVYPELVWDLDIQPEGGAIGLVFTDLGPIKNLQLVSGTYLLLEQDPGADSWMNASQLAVTFRLLDNLDLTMASGFYYYANTNAAAPGPNAIVRNDNSGNTAIDTDGDGVADSFTANFRVSDSFVNVTYTGLPMPLSFQGQYFHNFGQGAVRDDGYSFGVAYGRLKNPWNWRIYYQYQLVQQDAVFSPLSQDDFLRQTNFKGHLFGFALALHKNADLHAWGLLDKLDSAGGGRMQVRGRVDLNVRF